MYGRFPRQILFYVGEQELQMATELIGPDQSFGYRSVDIRDLDGEQLIESAYLGDNMIAILARLRDRREAVERVLTKIAQAGEAERQAGLYRLLILSGLRRLEEFVEQEARTMPILNDILENKVLGREFKRGLQEGREEGRQEGARIEAMTVLRRLIERRFGATPAWAEQRLEAASVPELEELTLRLLESRSVEELLN